MPSPCCAACKDTCAKAEGKKCTENCNCGSDCKCCSKANAGNCCCSKGSDCKCPTGSCTCK